MDVRVSVEDTLLSIHLSVNGNPTFWTIEINHPLVPVLSQITQGSFKGLELHPLYIVDEPEHLGDEIPIIDNEAPNLLDRVKEGLLYHSPEPCEDGVNGSYFLKDKEGTTIAIFKPKDEEGKRSPKKKKEEDVESLDRGIVDGEGAQREVAAFLLDRNHFASVPQTIMATLENFTVDGVDKGDKTGSLQEFVVNDGSPRTLDLQFSLYTKCTR